MIFEPQFVLSSILRVLTQVVLEFGLHLGVAEHALLDKFVKVTQTHNLMTLLSTTTLAA